MTAASTRIACWLLLAGVGKLAAAPPLSPAAEQALAKARADVQSAVVHKSLWTTAEEALKKAQEAAAKGDSNEVLKQSAIASEQALLGIEQTRYPPAR